MFWHLIFKILFYFIFIYLSLAQLFENWYDAKRNRSFHVYKYARKKTKKETGNGKKNQKWKKKKRKSDHLEFSQNMTALAFWFRRHDMIRSRDPMSLAMTESERAVSKLSVLLMKLQEALVFQPVFKR